MRPVRWKELREGRKMLALPLCDFHLIHLTYKRQETIDGWGKSQKVAQATSERMWAVTPCHYFPFPTECYAGGYVSPAILWVHGHIFCAVIHRQTQEIIIRWMHRKWKGRGKGKSVRTPHILCVPAYQE